MILTDKSLEHMLQARWCNVPGITMKDAALIAVIAIELGLNEESILAVESYTLDIKIKQSKNVYLNKLVIERHIMGAVLALSSKLNKSKWVLMVERLGFDVQDLEHLSKKIVKVVPIHRSSSTTLKLLGR